MRRKAQGIDAASCSMPAFWIDRTSARVLICKTRVPIVKGTFRTSLHSTEREARCGCSGFSCSWLRDDSWVSMRRDAFLRAARKSWSKLSHLNWQHTKTAHRFKLFRYCSCGKLLQNLRKLMRKAPWHLSVPPMPPRTQQNPMKGEDMCEKRSTDQGGLHSVCTQAQGHDTLRAGLWGFRRGLASRPPKPQYLRSCESQRVKLLLSGMTFMASRWAPSASNGLALTKVVHHARSEVSATALEYENLGRV